MKFVGRDAEVVVPYNQSMQIAVGADDCGRSRGAGSWYYSI